MQCPHHGCWLLYRTAQTDLLDVLQVLIKMYLYVSLKSDYLTSSVSLRALQFDNSQK